MNCIYCNSQIAETTDEHVVQSGLGARLSSKNLICKDCNNFFSRSDSGDIDKALVNQFKVIRNHLEIWSGRGQAPPILRNVTTEDGFTYDLLPGGIPVLAKTVRSRPIVEGSEIRLDIASPDLDKARVQYEHLLRQFGKNHKITSEVRQRLTYLKNPVHFGLTFGGEQALKGVLKSITNFLFYAVRDRNVSIGVTRDDLLEVINYLRYSGPKDSIAAAFDLKNEILLGIPPESFPIIVTVGAIPRHELIVGTLTVLGHITFSAILSNGYSGAEFGLGLAQFPNSSQLAFRQDVDFSNFNPDYPANYASHAVEFFATPQQRIEAILRVSYKRMTRKALEETIDKAFKDCFPPIGGIITAEHIHRLADHLAHNFVHLHYRIPQDLPFDPKALYFDE
ncbi:MAG: HNH endonuclease [Planctomycetes bacterium]|nr:HNH endonuclease [Planctomycetota bacterium]